MTKAACHTSALDIGCSLLDIRRGLFASCSPAPCGVTYRHGNQTKKGTGNLGRSRSGRNARFTTKVVNMSILQEPTVLVLGAGASHPYGLPLGPDLKAQMLGREPFIQGTAQGMGFTPQLVKAFHDALRYGRHQTVDIFLEKKTNLRELGSFLIAATLMPLERHDRLFNSLDWYDDLFDAMDFESETPDARFLSIVSLNYDRSFEHFLKMKIEYDCHHKNVEIAHAKRECIRVVHAHGSLGEYPQVPYGPNANDAATLQRAAASIKIVSDRLDDSPNFQKAQVYIAGAKHIVFLGFGYDERTLSALLAKTKLDEHKLYGTAFNLDEATTTRLQNTYGEKMNLGIGKDCRAFLREIGVTAAPHPGRNPSALFGSEPQR
jgi:hypothetical protein